MELPGVAGESRPRDFLSSFKGCQFCKETKEHFKKLQKSPCQECGECQGILKNRMEKLASSDVRGSYAGLTVKMLDPNRR